MNQRKFTLKELSQAIGRLQSLFTLPLNCEVCERKREVEVLVVTSTFVPVGVCLTCATTLIAHSVKRRNDTPLSTAVIANGRANDDKRTRQRKGIK